MIIYNIKVKSILKNIKKKRTKTIKIYARLCIKN